MHSFFLLTLLLLTFSLVTASSQPDSTHLTPPTPSTFSRVLTDIKLKLNKGKLTRFQKYYATEMSTHSPFNDNMNKLILLAHTALSARSTTDTVNAKQDVHNAVTSLQFKNFKDKTRGINLRSIDSKTARIILEETIINDFVAVLKSANLY